MIEKKLKILFLTNIPSPYRVLFFNELGEKSELTVLYQKGLSSERDSRWVAESKNTYRSVYLKGKSTGVDNAICPKVIKYLNKSYDAIIICGNASPTEILAIEWCKMKRIPYCLEGDGAFVKSGKGFKERLKKQLIRGGSIFFSTCKEHDNYYIHYGADLNKIKRYPFSSLTSDDVLSEPVYEDDKSILKKKIGVVEKKVVLAVGQFIPRKGFDLLLEIADKVEAEVYIVGGTPTQEYLNLKKENVHFIGFKTKEELSIYYKAADVFVHPTREDIWGLVVNEAMANGLPVVTTNMCNAGLELINNGENGFLIPINNSKELLLAINYCLANSRRMGIKSLEKISDYTIKRMVEVHLNILNEYCKVRKNDRR